MTPKKGSLLAIGLLMVLGLMGSCIWLLSSHGTTVSDAGIERARTETPLAIGFDRPTARPRDALPETHELLMAAVEARLPATRSDQGLEKPERLAEPAKVESEENLLGGRPDPEKLREAASSGYRLHDRSTGKVTNYEDPRRNPLRRSEQVGPGRERKLLETDDVRISERRFRYRGTVVRRLTEVRKGARGGKQAARMVCIRADEVLVRPRGDGERARAALREGGYEVRNRVVGNGWLCVRLPLGMDVEGALVAMKRSGLFAYAEPDYLVYPVELTPNDPSFSQQWALHNTGQTGGSADADIDAPEAWDVETGSNIVVAIIDTGVDYTHPDLAANVWVNEAEASGVSGVDDDGNGYVDDVYGYDFTDCEGDPTQGDPDPLDDVFHGTHCAGIVGAAGDNGVGVSGVCWNVKLMCLKFMGPGGGWGSDAILSIDYAVANGARVLSNSWGGGGYSQALHDAIDAAGQAGAVFVAAAGNDSSNTDAFPHYPSSYDLPCVISVASTNHSDGLSSFSNYGRSSVDLGAPGGDIYNTFPTYMTSEMSAHGFSTDYETISGTSMACPHVSGACALLWSVEASLSVADLKRRLMMTSDPVASLVGRCVAEGRLNLHNALLNQAPPRIMASISRPTEDAITGSAVEIWGTADATDFIRFTIEVGEGEIPTSWTTDGVTLVGGGNTPVPDGKLGDWAAPSASEGPWSIRLTVEAAAQSKQVTRTVTLDPYLKPGFPTYAWFGGGTYTSGTGINTLVADLNGDGRMEVLGTGLATGPLYASDSTGQPLPGWPVEGGATAYAGAWDVTGEGGAEVAATFRVTHGYWGLLNYGGGYLPNWPQMQSNYGSTSPVLADVDGDGTAEVVVNLEDRSIHVMRGDGTPLAGWPQGGSNSQRVLSPVVGDLDRDGKPEILAVDSMTSAGGFILGWNHDGTPLSGYPISLPSNGSYRTGLALGDVDGDGQMDVVCAGGAGVQVYSSDGTMKAGWPVTIPVTGHIQATPPVLADLDDDDIPEIVVGFDADRSGVCVLKGDGTTMSGWPRYSDAFSHDWLGHFVPVVGDIDGDGAPDIVMGFQRGGNGTDAMLFAFHANGSPLAGWPKYKPVGSGSVPAIVDIDGDGRNELVLMSSAWDGFGGHKPHIFAWDYNASGSSSGGIEWGQMGRDSGHAGCYPLAGGTPPFANDLHVNTEAGIPVDITLTGGDLDGDALSFSIESLPTHGTLSGTPPSVVYTPGASFTDGFDTFTFKVNDGLHDSNTATVTVEVSADRQAEWHTLGKEPGHSAYYPGNFNLKVCVPDWAEQVDTVGLEQVAVAHGLVFVSPAKVSNEGNLVMALNEQTGAEVWRFEADSSYDASAPTYAEGRVYVMRGNHSNDSQVWCIDAQTGASRWSAPYSVQWSKHYAPTVGDHTVYVQAGYFGGIQGFLKSNGARAFFEGLPMEDQWTPSYSDGRLFSWVEGEFREHDPRAGVTRWSLDLGGTTWSTVPAVVQGKAYILNYEHLRAVDLTARSVEWSVEGPFVGSPAVANGKVYAISGHSVKCYNASDGTFVRGYTADTVPHWQPIVTDDTLIVASTQKTYLFDLGSEQPRQVIPHGGYLSLARGRLYIATSAGVLHAYRFRTNAAPVARNDSAETDEDTAVAVDVLDNDTDADGDPLTVTGVTQGAHGSVVFDANSVTYTPNADFHGTDQFQYTASDGLGGTDDAVVTVVVHPVNDDPRIVAFDPGTPCSVAEGQEQAFIVTVQDPDGDPISYSWKLDGGNVGNGTAQYLYAPDYDAAGEHRLEVIASDGQGGSVRHEWVINVLNTNRAPVAYGQEVNTPPGTAIEIALHATDPDGDSLTYEVLADVSHGVLSGSAPDLTYTPLPGYSGPDGFTFRANDGLANSNVAMVIISVAEPNRAPELVSGPTATPTPAGIGQAVTFDVEAHDPNGDTMTFTWDFGDATGANGEEVTHAYGALGRYEATVTVTDGRGGSVSGSVFVDVVNAPPVAADDAAIADEDAATTIDVLANDTDPDGHALTILSVTQPGHGTASHDGAIVTYTPAPDFNGEDRFTYTVGDGFGGEATASVTVTVRPVNDAPVVVSLPVATPNPAEVGEAVGFAVLASDPDGDALTYTWAFGDGSTGNGSAPTHIYGAVDDFRATVTISDGQATVSVGVTVTVRDSALDLQVTKLVAKAIFKQSGRDLFLAKGTLIDLPADFDPEGASVTANLAGAVVRATLDRRGRGRAAEALVKLKLRRGVWTYLVRGKRGDWAGVWSAVGMVNETVRNVSLTLPFRMTIGGQAFRANVPVRYTAREGVKGVAKSAR